MKGTFCVRFSEFSLGSFDALCKIPGVKRLLLPHFSPNFKQTLEKACNRGKYRPLLFLAICQILKVHVYGTLKISYISKIMIATIHEAIYVDFI